MRVVCLYFLKSKKRLFLLFSATSLYGFLLQIFLYDDLTKIWLRPFGIVLFLIVAFSNNRTVRLAILALLLLISVLRVFTGTLE